MTTNQNIEDIVYHLDKAAKRDINIKIEYRIDASIDFLDVKIVNQQGRLRTSIYHKPTAEPYILPYTSDHPHHIHRNIPHAALLRAARLCSHLQDFKIELIRIDMSLLLNKYPPHFITRELQRFLRLHIAVPLIDIMDQRHYQEVHKKLLHQPTRRENQLQLHMKNPIKEPIILQPNPWNRKVMFPKINFDSGLTIGFPKIFHTWWEMHFTDNTSPAKDVKVRVVTKTNSTLEHYLIRKKPSKAILTRMQSTSDIDGDPH